MKLAVGDDVGNDAAALTTAVEAAAGLGAMVAGELILESVWCDADGRSLIGGGMAALWLCSACDAEGNEGVMVFVVYLS